MKTYKLQPLKPKTSNKKTNKQKRLKNDNLGVFQSTDIVVFLKKESYENKTKIKSFT